MRAKSDTKRITLAKVAQRAGVSITTVSVILSGREELLKQFHPDTVKKVRATAARLGYAANLFASGLPTKAPSFFALVIRFGGGEGVNEWYLWEFDGDLLAGAIRAAAEAGVYPIVGRVASSVDEASLGPIERLISGGVFGAIVRSPSPVLEKYLRQRLDGGLPVVVAFPNRLAAWPTNAIDVDNRALGEIAADLLARQRRRKWLLVRPKQQLPPQALRCEGFCRAARKLGMPVETIQIPSAAVSEYATARDFLAPRLKRLRYDGICAVESVASISSLLASLQNGLTAAEDFNLVGCDCAPWQNPPLPRITSIDVSWRQVGVTAFETLLRLARSGECRFNTILLRPRVAPADTCPVPADLLAPAR